MLLSLIRKFFHYGLICLPVVLASCVFVPVIDTHYDTGCQVEFKHMRLDTAQLGQIRPQCTNVDCTAVLLVGGAVGAASAVISGSIVLVGNTVYWMEKHGRCSTLTRPEAQPLPSDLL